MIRWCILSEARSFRFWYFQGYVPEKGIIYSKSRTAGVGHISRMFSQDVFGVGLHDLLIYSY